MRRRKLIIGVVATLALVGGSVAIGAVAMAASSTTVLKACVSRDGTMRAVSSSTTRCSQGRRLLVWNIRGQQGSRGSTGQRGRTGATGATGANGQSVVLTQQPGVLAVAASTTLTCSAGNQLAISGGFAKQPPDADIGLVSSMQVPGNQAQWIFTFAMPLTAAGTASITCASVGPAATPSPTPNPSGTPSGTPSATPSGTPSGTPSATPSGTPSETASATPSASAS